MNESQSDIANGYLAISSDRDFFPHESADGKVGDDFER